MTRVSVPAGARIVLASRNRHKVAELRAILADCLPRTAVDLQIAVVCVADVEGVDDVVEDGVTFAENALLKARAVHRATGLPAVADDSGLVVDVLGGAPGIFSARWAGRHGDDEANLRLLLAQLADVPDEHRGARFRCAAALVSDDEERVEHGDLAGVLTREPRGANGFGYDPILLPNGREQTCAELDPRTKNAISHRGNAMRALAGALARYLGGATQPGP